MLSFKVPHGTKDGAASVRIEGPMSLLFEIPVTASFGPPVAPRFEVPGIQILEKQS